VEEGDPKKGTNLRKVDTNCDIILADGRIVTMMILTELIATKTF